jgi:hypothetical protein
MRNESPIRTPLTSGLGFAFATIISALFAIGLFLLNLKNREPAWLDAISDPALFALIGFVGGALMFGSIAAGGRFAVAFLLYPSVARSLYQAGRSLPYGGAVLDLLASLYFVVLLPAVTTGIVGAIAVGILLRSQHFLWRSFMVFAIAGAIGGAVAPLLSWALSRMAAESPIAATLAIYGEELIRFFLAGFGVAWTLRSELAS